MVLTPDPEWSTFGSGTPFRAFRRADGSIAMYEFENGKFRSPSMQLLTDGQVATLLQTEMPRYNPNATTSDTRALTQPDYSGYQSYVPAGSTSYDPRDSTSTRGQISEYFSHTTFTRLEALINSPSTSVFIPPLAPNSSRLAGYSNTNHAGLNTDPLASTNNPTSLLSTPGGSSTALETIPEDALNSAERQSRPINQFSTLRRPLDRRYDFRDSSFFEQGRVFATLWHENDNSARTATGTDLTGPQALGERIYSTIRRMIVIKGRRAHCLCVPIVTYGGQGCSKSGLPRSEISNHTVAFMRGSTPSALEEERNRGMNKVPICIKPCDASQKLTLFSRINFNKTYTVEYNVKVMNVGMVLPTDIPRLLVYFRQAVNVS